MRLFRALLAIFLVIGGVAKATQDQNYGLGGTSTGRVSGVAAETENPFAAIYNPALLAAQVGPLFSFNTVMTGTSYGSLGKVLVDSPRYRTRDAVPRVEEFKLPDAQLTLWSIGFTYPFNLPKAFGRRAGLGVALSGPFSKLRGFSSGTPYDFVPLRYGTSDAQFKATAAGAVEVIRGKLYAGAGLSLYITTAGAADAVIVTDNPTGRLNFDVGLNTALLAGLFGKFGEHQMGLVFRQAIHPTFEQKFSGRVQILDGTGSVVLPVTLRTTLYYEPHMVEAEYQRQFGKVKLSAGVSYQLWSKYEPSYLTIESTDASSRPRATLLPEIPLHDTLNPRMSAEYSLIPNTLSLSSGYQYRPSPVGDLSGPGNLLDSDAHVVGLGISYQIKPSDWVSFPVTVGAYGQYHFLKTRQITKSDAGFVGAPNYEFSGRAYTYGLSLQANL